MLLERVKIKSNSAQMLDFARAEIQKDPVKLELDNPIKNIVSDEDYVWYNKKINAAQADLATVIAVGGFNPDDYKIHKLLALCNKRTAWSALTHENLIELIGYYQEQINKSILALSKIPDERDIEEMIELVESGEAEDRFIEQIRHVVVQREHVAPGLFAVLKKRELCNVYFPTHVYFDFCVDELKSLRFR